MGEYGREYKTDTELLEGISDSLTEITDLLSEGFINGESGGGDESSGEMSESVGEMGKMFEKLGKTLKKAPGLFILQQLMSLLEPLMMILEPIVVVFEILGALLSVFSGEIMAALFEALQPVFDVLLELTPIFKFLGQIIGMLMKIGLIPLKILFEIIGAILKPFMPLFEKLSPIFEVLGTVLSWLIRIGLLPLILAVYGIGLAIAALVNFFTFGAVDAIAGWNGMMLPILSSMVTPMAEGGILTGPGIFMGGEGGESEAVVPLSKASQLGFGGGGEEHLMDISDGISELVTIQRRQSRGLQRGRFGR